MSAVTNTPVYVYSGPAADPHCVEATVKMLEQLKVPAHAAGTPFLHDLERLKKARAIVIPGSASTGLLRFGMGDLGIRNIYTATQGFGRPYLGLCAGAFMASSSVVYHGEHLYNCPTPRLYQGAAEVSQIAGETDPNARTVHLSGQSGRLAYQNGPSFPRAASFKGVTVLGTYKNGEPAIIHSNNAVLSGVHPELTQTPFARAAMRMMLTALKLL